VHPVVARLCDVIAGTDAAQLAACLGLETSSFAAKRGGEEEASMRSLSRFMLTDEERFSSADRLRVACPHCQGSFEFAGLFSPDKSKKVLLCLHCPLCEQSIPAAMIRNTLTLAVRGHVAQHYDSPAKCTLPC
jgi:DNA polymerase alpha subunit A